MTKSEDQMQKVNQIISEAFRDSGLANMFRSPSYRYYEDRETKDRYFYTTEKINHKGKPRYVAGVYRYLKTRKQFKLVKRVGFAKKYKAKDWASKAKEKATSPEVA